MEYDSICLQDAEILRIAKKIVTVREISMGSYVGLEKSREGIQRLEGNKILGAV